MSQDNSVHLIPPSFRLQRKVGGPAAHVLTPDVYRKAEKVVADLVPPIEVEVHRLLDELYEALTSRQPRVRDLIWSNAHEIRGMAGTVGKVCLGQAANLICQYLHDTKSSFEPDREVMQTITVIAFQALRDDADADPMIKVLVQDGARAILAQRHREGRD